MIFRNMRFRFLLLDYYYYYCDGSHIFDKPQ